MDGLFNFLIFVLLLRFELCHCCDCKMVDILRNIVQREMMERGILASRVDMLESKLGTGIINVENASETLSDKFILERLSVIETMIEDFNTKLKETTMERRDRAHRDAALTNAWKIHKHDFWVMKEDIQKSISDIKKKAHDLTREVHKHIEVTEFKEEELIINRTSNVVSKEMKIVEERFEAFQFGLKTSFQEHTTQMNRDYSFFTNNTNRTLNDMRAEIMADECSNNPCLNGATCVDGLKSYSCICIAGYKGTRCQIDWVASSFSDCYDVQQHELGSSDGVYNITLWRSKRNIQVFCDLTTDGGGWTVFQNRFDGSVDFYRNFVNYTSGFGNLNGEIWLGLDIIHEMTTQRLTELRIDLTAADGRKGYAVFKNFSISEGPGYVLHNLPGTGTLEQSENTLTYHTGQSFSTYDHDNDRNCAITYRGAWWYNSCYQYNLNGRYLSPGTEDPTSMNYFRFTSYQYSSLRSSRMMFRVQQ